MSTKTAVVNQNVFTLLFSQIRDFGANFEKSVSAEDTGKPRLKFAMPKLKFNFPKGKFTQKAGSFVAFLKRRPKMAIGVGLGLLVIIAALIFSPGVNPNSAIKKVAGSQTDFSPEKQVSVGKTFGFPIRDKEGNDTGNKLNVSFTTMERANRVLYSGKPLIAKQGKDFIIANIEIENITKDRLTVRPVDFIRLIDAQGRNYAADLQTNNLKVEALSIKKTRTIFIVSEDAKTLKFLIGEINGNRETFEVTL